MCGGTRMDAHAISTGDEEVLFFELRKHLKDAMAEMELQDDNGKARYVGAYVFGDPQNGEVYNLENFQRIIPNPHLAKKNQDDVRGWYKYP
jgi:hypothetical protein